MIADMHNNEKLNKLLVNELFIRERNEIFLLFLSRNHVLKYQQMLNLTLHNFLLWKLQMRALQQIVYNHSLNIDFKNYVNL